MTIEINHKTTIGQIQKQFRKAFPFLKIRFADQPHQFGESIDDIHFYPYSVRVSETSESFVPGTLTIMPDDKTGDIELAFIRLFKLYPQIFRKDEYQWIQSSDTDIIPIGDQNETGKKSVEKITPEDGIQNIHLL